MTTRPRTIAIVGGGFSAVSLVAHLTRLPWQYGLRVVVFERAASLARGVAYSTPRAEHLLNVPAGRMGVFADDEGHFLRWLRASDAGLSGNAFVPRSRYGDYLEHVLQECTSNVADGVQIETVRDEVLAVVPASSRVKVELASGKTVEADCAVLATGTPAPRGPEMVARALRGDTRYVADPWAAGALEGLSTQQNVLIIGTGLTMVDVVLALRERGHQGFIAVSRRGLLPQSHRDWPTPPPPIDLTDRLARWDGSASALLRVIRDAARHADLAGLDWRDVINGLRSRSPELWQRMSPRERRRFLQHVRPYWETHRHRMSTRVASEINGMIFHGALAVYAGEIEACVAQGDHVALSVRTRGNAGSQLFSGGTVINCTGPDSDYGRIREPLFVALREHGLIARDPLALGIPTDEHGAIFGADDVPSPVLFTLGSTRRGGLWESTAVPEIRAQASRLAARLHA